MPFEYGTLVFTKTHNLLGVNVTCLIKCAYSAILKHDAYLGFNRILNYYYQRDLHFGSHGSLFTSATLTVVW